MSADWSLLRPWAGDQRQAFEELVCQLARLSTPGTHAFRRLDPPDGGVECYATAPNGDEQAWQAKWFPTSLGTTQWNEIEESVTAALKGRPKLTEYVVCLPQNLTEPTHTQKGKRVFGGVAKWSERVAKWASLAPDRKVTFKLWGSHELEEILQRPENIGRRAFWFGATDFTPTRVRQRVDAAIADAGPKYTSDFNVDVPIVTTVQGLQRRSTYRDGWQRASRLLRKSARDWNAINAGVSESIATALSAAAEAAEKFAHSSRQDTLDGIAKHLQEASRNLDVLDSEDRPHAKQTDDDTPRPSVGDDGKGQRYRRAEAREALNATAEVVESAATSADVRRTLIIVGPAGIGKTHLLCDVANDAAQRGKPVVIVHGSRLDGRNPLREVVDSLALTCSGEDFLAALDAAGEANQERALLIIDALNESREGGKHWADSLAGLASQVAKHPWVALVVSVRDTYREYVLPKTAESFAIRAHHYGFDGVLFDATASFFSHYRVADPPFPRLHPEFRNPLFLKLYCAALSDRAPDDARFRARSFDEILGFVLDDISSRVCPAIGIDPVERPVHDALKRVALAMHAADTDQLPYAEAKRIVDGQDQRRAFVDTLFRQLLSEGLLVRTRRYGVADELVEFGYQRYWDEARAGLVIEDLLALPEDQRFANESPLMKMFERDRGAWDGGVLESLAARLPSVLECEVVELATPSPRHVWEAWIHSLAWRPSPSKHAKRLREVALALLKHEPAQRPMFDALVFLSSDPEHPLNADFLCEHLSPMPVADRDAVWTATVSEGGGAGTAVEALLEWAAPDRTRPRVADDAIRLAACALAWLLASPHRRLRDRATKALTVLFVERPSVVVPVLERLGSANDPYIVERLFCAAYGAATRWPSTQAELPQLAAFVASRIFQAELPRCALTRDYARGVMELAAVRGCVPAGFDIRRSRPPYGSGWPTFPTKDELSDYGRGGDDNAKSWARVHFSVFGFSDFNRYVIGTNSGMSYWLVQRHDEPLPLTPEERVERWAEELGTDARRAWRRLVDRIDELNSARFMAMLLGRKHTQNRGNNIKAEVAAVRAALTPPQRSAFEADILPTVQSGMHRQDGREYLSADVATAYVFSRVVELGWTAERFGHYDRVFARDRGRMSHESERFAKKYMWIGWHEFVGLASDRFRWSGRHGGAVYDGPWQLYLRDIDPTMLLPQSVAPSSPSVANLFAPEVDDAVWMTTNALGVPAIEELLRVEADDGGRWYTLKSSPDWNLNNIDDHESHVRRTQFVVQAYLVRRNDEERFSRWARRQTFFGRWMPGNDYSLPQVFLGERYWAPSVNQAEAPTAWTRGDDDLLPVEVLIPDEDHHWESEYDKSIDATVSIGVPSRWLGQILSLRWSPEQSFVDPQGRVSVAYRVDDVAQAGLRISADALGRLNELGYTIVWTVLGEKIATKHDERTAGWLQIDGVYSLGSNGEPIGSWKALHGNEPTDGTPRAERARKQEGTKAMAKKTPAKTTPSPAKKTSAKKPPAKNETTVKKKPTSAKKTPAKSETPAKKKPPAKSETPAKKKPTKKTTAKKKPPAKKNAHA